LPQRDVDLTADPLPLYQSINRDGTLALARQAAQAGVRRFIFISSIKVNGEATKPGQPYTAMDTPSPVDPYGISKAQAEAGLKTLAETTSLQYTIIRPPLIYGPGVKANFAALIRAVQRGTPLPLGSIDHNRRSLVALDNLLSLIQTCLAHPNAANQTFLVSDGEDLSSAELARRIGQACARPARLIPVPVWLMKLGATLLGKPGVVQRLTGSLQVDIQATRTLLDWSPVIRVDEGLRKTIQS
jgi:nucleoside-diphosphate-sugar epimerase